MISMETFTAFIIASTILCAAPGPDNLFVLTQSALFGRKPGFAITLGLCTGLIVHTSAVAMGVAVIFQTSEIAYNLMKIAGALYLLYLAWLSFMASASTLDDSGAGSRSLSKLYKRGIIMNVTNPKVSIFVLAFLPQFVKAEQGSVALQVFQLGAIFMVTTLLVFGAIVMLAGSIGNWLSQSEKAQIYLNRIAGSVFVLMASWLFLGEL